MKWREPEERDLEPCLRAQPPYAIGDAIVGRARALAVWRQLLRDGLLISRVVETETAGRKTIRGLGSSVFVSPDFLAAEVSNPRPDINARIFASIAAGAPVILNRDQIARGNAGDGLDAVFLTAVMWPTSTPQEFTEMMTVSLSSCVEAHAGYRLRSVVAESPAGPFRAVGTNSGDMEFVGSFDEIDRVLWRLTREGASTAIASFSNLLFQYREPVLGLRPVEQQLLAAALSKALDRELASKLGVTVATVKKRWRSIFETIEDVRPEILRAASREREGARGPQKRHLVLSYVREHPEEIRPFAAGAPTTC
jgi:hypothetical protein